MCCLESLCAQNGLCSSLIDGDDNYKTITIQSLTTVKLSGQYY